MPSDEESNSVDKSAPLIKGDARDQNPDGNLDSKDTNGVNTRIRRFLQWLRNNIKILALTALLLGGVITMVTYIALSRAQKSDEPADSVCLTPACVVAAAGIIQNMSPDHKSIDPCEDFSQYVCGGWKQQHDLRPDQESVHVGAVMYEKSQQTLRQLLEMPYSQTQIDGSTAESADQVIFTKIQSAYNACMDEEMIKHRGSKPLLDVLMTIDKYFPIDSANNHQEVSLKPEEHRQKRLSGDDSNPLTKTVAYLSSIGVSALVSFDVDADEKDPDSVVLTLNALFQPGLPSKEYYKDKDLLQRYGKTIGVVLEALLREARPSGQHFADKNLLFECNEELVQALVQFEANLALASPSEEDAEDVTKSYNPRSLVEVQTLLPQLSVLSLLSTLAPAGFKPQKVIVGSPSYLKALAKQLDDAEPETIRAYLVWKAVQAYVDQVEDEALIPLKRFNNQIRGKDPDASADRWRTCVRAVDRGLGWILSRLFIEKAFSEDAKAFGDQIIHDIKDQFAEKLKNAEWMSKDVRDVAIEKVHRIVQKIGYPTKNPDLLDASAVQKYYQGLRISNNSYFANTLAIAEFRSRREWAKLGKPTNRDEWLMTAVTVNAYFNPPLNEIVFPAGIMQPPIFYDPSLPSYISYGPFGSISGHELTHAFDSNGRHYDETGNYTDWWDDDTIQAFKQKAECFVDQYSNFTILDPEGKELHVNGKLTLGENIADAGGLSAAFHAWKKIEEKTSSQLLPGLQHYSKEQMFFITYPSLFCGKTRRANAVERIYKDAHAPDWARILGTVANTREFREAFECPIREPTCELW
ncbi:MAG: hypothetical protein L6R37_004263 [Teloschistes peruensis]|nr:MAG: hypothetical protein L6R37_004263 [Teloschistes peruensis]